MSRSLSKAMSRSLALIVRYALLLIFAGNSMSTVAAEWARTAGVQLGSYFTDNVCLAPDDQQGKAVGTVTPNLALQGDGGRARISLRANVEYNTLGNSSLRCDNGGAGGNMANREAWIPRLDFVSSLDLIDNWLFLEADAFAARNPINPFAAGGDENINGLANTNITYQWGAGARIQHGFSEGWDFLLRYNYSEQYNTQDIGIGDNQEDLVTLDAGMAPEASRFALRVAAQYREIQFDAQRGQPEFSNRLSRAELRSFFALTDSFSLTASAGEEDNIFTSDSEEIDGSFWDVGVRWVPNARVSMGAGYGERFFGDAPRFDISYRHKRSQLTAAYVRDVQFPRNLRTEDDNFNPEDPLDTGVGVVPGDSVNGAGVPTFVGNSPILNEQFTLRYSFFTQRTDFSLSGRESLQTRTSDGRKGDFRTVTGAISRRLSRATRVYVRLRWQNNEATSAVDGLELAQDLEVWQFTSGLSRQLTPKSSVGLQYRYSDQTSDINRNNFVEQRIGVTYSYNF
ncbi:MAG: hypothetical protein ACI8SI_002161 [Congregibacter sp.]